jgi:serine/threonine protein kinase/Tol biopolymer transport system component
MALAPGTRIRSYEIVGALGAGGMGEVYRARDLKLNRDVAIKVLPPFLAADGERLARFSREAQVLASLNHPNIAHIHGFEDHVGDGTNGALIMELVDGPTLADRLTNGALPLDETLAVGKQIVAALDAAHAQGIVHRDLKPANIKVRDDGTVKVLDFGLAKLASPDSSGSGAALANSPTLTAQSTQLGTIIGTAAYMSPEQAKGKPVDKRADIWAFGAVLFEMLAGRPLFEGETISEVLASVLKDEPRWGSLPANTPTALRRILSRCLERDPKRRLHDIADVLPDLDEAERPGAAFVSSDRRPIWLALGALLAGAALMAVVLLLAGTRWRQAPQQLRSLTILAPPGQPLINESADSAISPDGRSIVYAAGPAAATASLWVRALDNSTPRVLPGTKGAFQPFWSPDGARIGFFADGKLKTIRLDNNAVVIVCDAPDPRGGTWNASGEILLAPSNAGGLMKVAAEGGDPQPATTLDASHGETAHRFPYFLPDGRHFVFVALPGHGGHLDVVAASIDDKERKVVTAADSGVTYAAPGYLVYMRQNGTAAQAFNARQLAVTGDPITLSDLPGTLPTQWTGSPPVSTSTDGTLVYYDEGSRDTRFVWYDLKSEKPMGTVVAPEGTYQQVAISPDGRYAATVRVESAGRADIWLLDLQRGGTSRLTNGPGQNNNPSWSPDGKQIAFVSDRNNQTQIYVKPIDGGEERQVSSDDLAFKSGGPWVRDGSALLFTALDPKTGQDIWILPIQGNDHKPKPYIRSQFNDTSPTVSPDGRYVSYMSDETGQVEMYVQTYPTPTEKYRVTTGGAAFGGWLPDGRLAYGVPGTSDAYYVTLLPGPPMHTSPPQAFGSLPQGTLSADLMPDLSKMLALMPAERNAQISLSVVLNWAQMLGGRRP